MIAPLAVSIGDPAGIGPEIVAKAWGARHDAALLPFFAVGDARAIEAVWAGPLARITDPSKAETTFNDALPVLDLEESGPVRPGHPSLESARSALDALEIAVGLARSGAASAVVTGPIAKAQMYAIGFRHPGQTEFIAERCGVAPENIVMLLAGRDLRVVPATIHVPFGEVLNHLTTDLLVSRGRALARGLKRDFGIDAPRIAVAGLNPHAGENGALGSEEADIIQPAIDILQADDIDCFGPISPDTLFARRTRETYDAALCMYHDQALIPVKTLYFDEGVNMTLGLPIIRTSPDHGTAFGIAGSNRADPGATIAAIRMAADAASIRHQAG
jgi:4-hydroxythreonine-4-phosphate dehydrogenase